MSERLESKIKNTKKKIKFKHYDNLVNIMYVTRK